MSKKPPLNFGRWIRFYIAALDDPKVQMLPDPIFKTWINLLCLAGAAHGALPDVPAIAFKLRLPEREAEKRIGALVSARLIDETPAGLVPHDWDERQFVSDGSTVRVQRFRNRQRNVSGNVSETAKPAFPKRPRSESVSESVSVSESAYQCLDDSQSEGGDQ